MPNTHHHKSRKIIKSFEAEALKKRPLVIKVADFFTSSFGTIGFLLFNIVLYAVWIYLNSGRVNWFIVIDPFPHNFLNTFISLEALGLTITVLISQNRANQIDRLRQELQLQVNLLSEKETTKVLQIVKKIADTKGINIKDDEIEEMINEIDASYIERKLEEQMKKAEGLHSLGNGNSK